MAKIAFAYLTSRLGAPFVLKEEFNEIRSFIRYGIGKADDLVGQSTIPLLHEEKGSGPWSLTQDHLVTVSRSKAGGLVGEVSLFNLVRHSVVLARRNPEIIHLPAIPTGHRFNWKERNIVPLPGWEEDNLVQPFDVLRR